MSILEFGNESSDVALLQAKLQEKGYVLKKIDGIFGSKTREAVLEFQRRAGLTVDGLAGPRTMSAINGEHNEFSKNFEDFSATRILKVGSEGNDVTSLQIRLQAIGYTLDEIDGIFGSDTKQAVMEFQSDVELTADGLAGPQTMATLNRMLDEFLRNSENLSALNTLQVGSENNNVTSLQTKLQSIGYTLNDIDGKFGSNTQQAVLAFQHSVGIIADGLVGTRTIVALNGKYNEYLESTEYKESVGLAIESEEIIDSEEIIESEEITEFEEITMSEEDNASDDDGSDESDEDSDSDESDEDGDSDESDDDSDSDESDEDSNSDESDEDGDSDESDEDGDSDESDDDGNSDESDEDGDSDESGEDGNSDESDEDGDSDESDEDGDSDESDEDGDSDESGEDGDSDESGEDGDSDESGEDGDSDSDEDEKSDEDSESGKN
ncbi:MAG: peptidoglycan-binding protein [Massilia sp.]|nr:peptidoglycan-binding protein [Massilia sp.]